MNERKNTEFLLNFELQECKRLDQFALQACQAKNYGNTSDWFGAFRGGLYGFYARIHGITVHYRDIHAWIPKPRLPTETEYHLAAIFFHMDSAIECFIFGLNALGCAVSPPDFRDVTDEKELRRINPTDLLGNPGATPPRQPLSGYAKIFPNLQAHWQANSTLLSMIFEQHDVSKHRQAIFQGGMSRQDPPPGFYESLGIEADSSKQAIFWPMAEIILGTDLKKPLSQRVSQEVEEFIYLENVVDKFRQFIKESCARAATDAEAHIPLPPAPD